MERFSQIRLYRDKKFFSKSSLKKKKKNQKSD